MANILCLETSASLCSVGLYTPEKTYYLENQKTLAHAEFLAPLIQQILDLANLNANNLSSIAISGGPGSYTGLRIGCSTAKGLCYALNIPLIAIDTLQIIAEAAVQQNSDYDYYWPMIDARRMEVYHTIFDKNLNPLQPTTNSIIDEAFLVNNEKLIIKNEASVILSIAKNLNSSLQKTQWSKSFMSEEIEKPYFDKLISTSSMSEEIENLKSNILKSKIALCGDGATKSSESLNLPVINAVANALAMSSLAVKKFETQQFEDTAYYEPFYLKQANITESKK
ncbi:MAG: tRNA (adenosine(37)-N6)-threonylcarbamoyltransferase complex dimerization subunit type 1 TsaB [Bacteroidetes bacterium]|nr:tRNA (adenosine(37)-N6)-threonylcarbamoyltransferase complex dimerization subunit type 1 TsaB [Bacteroidota bacterium]